MIAEHCKCHLALSSSIPSRQDEALALLLRLSLLTQLLCLEMKCSLSCCICFEVKTSKWKMILKRYGVLH